MEKLKARLLSTTALGAGLRMSTDREQNVRVLQSAGLQLGVLVTKRVGTKYHIVEAA